MTPLEAAAAIEADAARYEKRAEWDIPESAKVLFRRAAQSLRVEARTARALEGRRG